MKRDWPDRALVVSLMVPCEEENWADILKRVEETGCDGVELNFGCPHGMSERGMGSAVGQVPEYIEMVARWCKAHTRMPVIVKLTPNITNIRYPARAAKKGGADAVSLINTVNSITSVDLDSFSPEPSIDGKGSHGGYCGAGGEADRAFHGVGDRARRGDARDADLRHRRHHDAGATRRSSWRSAPSNVQVCTAAMAYGFKIVKEMIAGLERWMDEKGYDRLSDFAGRAVPNVTDWQYLNLNYITKAQIDQELCIKCGRCHIACEDTSHQAITEHGRRQAPLRGDRRGMRRVQSVRRGLPGGGLHHHAAACRRRDRCAHRQARWRRATPTGPRTPTIRWRGRRRNSFRSPWDFCYRRGRPARAQAQSVSCKGNELSLWVIGPGTASRPPSQGGGMSNY